MKKIQIQILETMLRLWEDANIFGEFTFRSYLKAGSILGKLKTQPGSEVSIKADMLFRSILNFKNFRILLEREDEVINSYAFLPRVPKSLREEIGDDRELFGEKVEMGGVLLFPTFISKWILGKKVFCIKEETDIPFIPLNEENHLNHLPYDDFIIITETPFIGHFPGTEKDFNFKTLMVSRREDHVHVMIIPEEIKDYIYLDEERKTFEKLTSLMMSKNQYAYIKERKHAMKVFLKEDGELDTLGNFFPESVLYAQIIRIEISSGKYSFRGFDDKDFNLAMSEVGYNQNPGVNVSSYLNGICKVISEIGKLNCVKFKLPKNDFVGVDKKGKTGRIISNSPINSDDSEEELSWNEVLEGQVLHLSSEYKPEGTAFIVKHGSEKCTHLRRGHYRHYDQKHLTVWVKSSTIRRDLLIDKESFRSRSSIIKD
jgi:hypothetical protein